MGLDDDNEEYACTCEAGWHAVGTKCPDGGKEILQTADDWL